MIKNSDMTLDELLGTNVDTAHFGMYTLRGNALVRAVVKKMITAFESGADAATMADIYFVGKREIQPIFPEITDTAVREAVFGTLERTFAKKLDFFDAQDLIDCVIDRVR